MKKKNIKGIRRLVPYMLAGLVTGCGISYVLDKTDENHIINNEDKYMNEVIEEETSVIITSSEEPEIVILDDSNNQNNESDTLLDQIKVENIVIATSDVNIRDMNSNIIGVLPEGSSLKMINEVVDGKYEVEYYGNNCTVSSDYATVSTDYHFMGEPEKIVYCTEDKEISIIDSIDGTYSSEIKSLSELECLKVYAETDNEYLVETNDYIGKVTKENTEELTDTFVVVDISDQELNLYNNKDIILSTPVVTGEGDTPSDEGLFEIYSITRNRYLIGPNYKSYVDVMMSYNGGEGLHDAEYHTNEDGKSHGWRNYYEFGGNTYINNGSHGCINMPHDAAITVSENVNVGTKVLVKK